MATDAQTAVPPVHGPLESIVWVAGGLLGGAVMDAAQVPWGAIIGGLAGVAAAWIGADGRRKADTIDDLRRKVDRLERDRHDHHRRDDIHHEDEDDACGSKASETR